MTIARPFCLDVEGASSNTRSGTGQGFLAVYVSASGKLKMLKNAAAAGAFAECVAGDLSPARYAKTLRAALPRAKVTDYVRPFHDGRHTSITNSVAAGMEPMKMMKRAGHADLATTMLYVNLAGETFPEAAELLEERLFGQKSGQK